MNKILEYFETNSKIFMQQPIKDMEELKFRMQLLDQCRKDDEEMEGKISPIEAKYAKLAEFDVVPEESELSRKNQMRVSMEKFKETLQQAEMIISKEKKKMKAGLEQDLATFGQSIRDVKVAFSAQAPFKSDGITNEQAFGILQTFRQQLASKRKLEEEFLPKLQLFGMEAANYKELEWVDQELDKMQIVWEIRDNWDGEWNRLRLSVFKTLNSDDMDELAMNYQGRMRKLQGKDKNVQNWPVFQNMKKTIEEFRSTL
eukprot:CAMPEP_0178446682 /NCGR_PEP_ID=MMETSP0689_2-20121128/40951_1 /TAXON_ID=160604 /ORGANISM="Amphidinium massartii, Strain CS-259" /LENGTH=257 /DNA_ID=CAMNT_0020071557 /DNA_START=54 /DNA_END=823 /DNA_ORIENTATION=-